MNRLLFKPFLQDLIWKSSLSANHSFLFSLGFFLPWSNSALWPRRWKLQIKPRWPDRFLRWSFLPLVDGIGGLATCQNHHRVDSWHCPLYTRKVERIYHTHINRVFQGSDPAPQDEERSGSTIKIKYFDSDSDSLTKTIQKYPESEFLFWGFRI